MRALARRLDGLRRAGMAAEAGRIVVIAPDHWPDDVRAAYDAACAAGDQERQADLIEFQTGERPVVPRSGVGPARGYEPIAVVEIRRLPDGSQ